MALQDGGQDQPFLYEVLEVGLMQHMYPKYFAFRGH